MPKDESMSFRNRRERFTTKDREGKARFHRMSHSTKNESKSRKSETDDLRIARNPDDESKLKKAKEQLGEELSGFDALEWDTGAPAYNPELINLKTDINKITVFKASTTVNVPSRSVRTKMRKATPKIEKAAAVVTVVSPQTVSLKTGVGSVNRAAEIPKLKDVDVTPQTPPVKEPVASDKADMIGELVAELVGMFLKNKVHSKVYITLELIHTKRIPRMKTRSAPTSLRKRHSGSSKKSQSSSSLREHQSKTSSGSSSSNTSMLTNSTQSD